MNLPFDVHLKADIYATNSITLVFKHNLGVLIGSKSLSFYLNHQHLVPYLHIQMCLSTKPSKKTNQATKTIFLSHQTHISRATKIKF